MTGKDKGVSGDPSKRTHWQDVYGRKPVDEVSWFQTHPQLSLRLIRNSGVPADAPIIDVGGGASVLADCLLDRGYTDITVLDISAAALATSQARLGNRAQRVEWITASVVGFQPARTYALWHDRALFHFMTTTQERGAYVDALLAALEPGGQAIIATFASDGPRRCSGLDIVRYDAAGLMAELGEAFELLQFIDESHRTPTGGEQKFTYFRCRKR